MGHSKRLLNATNVQCHSRCQYKVGALRSWNSTCTFPLPVSQKMQSLHENVALPPALVPAFPTAAHIRRLIDPFTFWLLSSTIRSHPHYENDLYGPIDQMLNAIFPANRHFVIKPQALLRAIVSPDVGGAGDLSFGEYGGTHRSRTRGTSISISISPSSASSLIPIGRSRS